MIQELEMEIEERKKRRKEERKAGVVYHAGELILPSALQMHLYCNSYSYRALISSLNI